MTRSSALRRVAAAIVVTTAAWGIPGGVADAAPRAVPAKAEPQSQRTVEIQILGLNETHGQLAPLRRDGRLAGGAATLSAYMEREEAENPRTLVDASGASPEGIEPYVIEKLKGVKVGIIGVANPDTKNVTLPSATEDLTFLDVAGSAAAVNAAAGDLVAKGVETIVVVAHQGLASALARKLQ